MCTQRPKIMPLGLSQDHVLILLNCSDHMMKPNPANKSIRCVVRQLEKGRNAKVAAGELIKSICHL